ncbi:uncharacterized protein LOC128216927 isoform X2 [Mya arenaria]|uniref:uncharacterized protein LOC128216927 isoform X2 n=1 Tax=Mya arenaria TaxID=6604 RepID=UPI0022E4662A|nr:uncharacterized protein LOC128216927 isoform X2 [Mya arenaria]
MKNIILTNMRSQMASSVGTRHEFDASKRTWDFTSLQEVHVRANALLRQAMLNERYKRWKKVIELYKELLWLISLEHFPDDYEPPSSYSMLLYELHFHLGVAFQHVGKHSKAVKEFGKTIEVVSIAKNGCLAGCLTNSCLMTPIYARRSFAYAKLGSYKNSLKDAETAVVLDSQSADVFCIRALVRSTFDDELLGLKDLETALKLDKNHVCAVMLSTSFTKPLVTDNNEKYGFFEKAVRLCEDAETYLTCNSFSHSCILEFYDKFLFPLSVPHTITRIDLRPEKPSKKQLESKVYSKKQGDTEPTSIESTKVFRCGTTANMVNNLMPLQRRKDYGNAIRKHMARPKTAAEFFAQLEKEQKRDAQQKRAQSAIVRPGERFARSATSTETENSRVETRPTTSNQNEQRFSTPSQSVKRRPFTAPAGVRMTSDSPVRSGSPEKPNTSPEFRKRPHTTDAQHKTSSKKNIVIETPSNYSISVFQSTNIKFAPRMYYRPWSGDKLPVSERPPITFAPKFY